MKVIVDQAMCEGHGKCEMAAPLIFELRDDDVSYVLVDEVPADQEKNVERAMRLCPRQAIYWEKERASEHAAPASSGA